MKVLYLITKSNFGGAQKYTYELAVAAAANGHDVTVACGGTGSAGAETGELARRLESAGIRVIVIKNFMRDISWRKECGAFFEIYQLLRRERPDVLHISSSKAGGIGTLAGRMQRVPSIIFTVHGLPSDEMWRPYWQRWLITKATQATCLLAHAVIVLSKETAHRVTSSLIPAKKVHIIYNGVMKPNLLERKEARTILSIPSNVFCIGGIGELHPNKNWSTALVAIPNLPADTHFCLIGDGEERAVLETQIKQLDIADRVHLAGYLPDAVQFLAAFDIFVLPSKKEGLPYVILEAGSAGLPVVASDLPGLREIITTGENGILIDQDVTALTASLTMLLRDEGMRQRLGNALRDDVESTFSYVDMSAKTMNLYSTMSGSTARIAA